MNLLSWHHLSRRLSGGLVAALMLATLAPAVSRAVASGVPQDRLNWVALCTAQGMQWVLASELGRGPAATPDSVGATALDLCGHCTLAAERFAPLLPGKPLTAAGTPGWPTPWFLSTELRSAEAPCAAARGPPLPG
ncbi:DUF2946 family protein [Hydrogenophaga pseudoflava]|uniref:DUF2946 family protein n=1 Tax=Hydrogenophaga pseudoflava TaxID=47421 RepID=UPI0027E3D056|nr:DUF2946 family protein [Hydrogenophaga pseudoflava]MDQ7744904.1 DUF2946 family protein [Hydrogenophaga pseudoflava]